MEYVRLGSSGLKVSRISLGCMSFGTPRPMTPWTLDKQASRPVAASDHGADRRLPAPPGHRLRRPLPDPPLRSADPGRGDHGGAARRGQGREGTVHRRIVQYAWQFAKMQQAASTHGWTRFVSMQDQYSLLQREEEREMLPLLADQGVGSIPWSPLAGGKVTRPWGETGSARADTNPVADPWGRPLFYESDKAIVDAVQRIAQDRGVPMAQVALAWVLRNPVVSALEAPYTPREPTYFS